MPTPARHLSGATELLREFNHDSLYTKAEWEYPAASYRALGALSGLVEKLEQAIEQSVRPVMHTYEHGRVRIDGGGDADQAVRHMLAAVDNAKKAAGLLSATVKHLHAITSPMGLDTAGLPGFDD
ncbi:hypothetical protein ACIP4S_13180 [Streptomyces chartreusis]|uniref:hypothetical protein n=1 Tax=Streptomyces chartreusis TaxID=1969 RepID=UPI0038235C3D